MSAPRFRTASQKKKVVTLPTNRKVIHYHRGVSCTRSCGICGRQLTVQPANRPLSGQCPSCMRATLSRQTFKVIV